MPRNGYPAGFFPAERVRAYLSTYPRRSVGAESEFVMGDDFDIEREIDWQSIDPDEPIDLWPVS